MDSDRAHLFNPNNIFLLTPTLSHPNGNGCDCISIYKSMRSTIHRKEPLSKVFTLVTSKYNIPFYAN